MNLEELKYDLCEGCGERSPYGQEILAIVNHSCPLNTVTYRMPVSMSLKRMFEDIFAASYGGRTSMSSIYDLLKFDYLKAMPDYDTASDFDRKCYYWCREAEVKHMKRLRAYIDLEEAFNVKY